MGCDWYKIKSITGVGFSTSDISKYKSLLDLTNRYKCYIYADHDENGEIVVRYFIYDVDTLLETNISVPGPYDIEPHDHSVEYQKKTEYNKYFGSDIQDLNKYFDLDETSNFCSLLTTAGVEKYGEFPNDQKFKEYYGYV